MLQRNKALIADMFLKLAEAVCNRVLTPPGCNHATQVLYADVVNVYSWIVLMDARAVMRSVASA
eukprot:9717634-Lingulodinium_polyedra.AAC.1